VTRPFAFDPLHSTLCIIPNNNEYIISLKRNSWNLVSICQDMQPDEIDMTGIKEIQSQDGKSIYTGDFAIYSNLLKLEMGYGYWIKGDEGVLFSAKDGLSLPSGFTYQTINNKNEIIQTTLNGLTIKLYANYAQTADAQATHIGIVVRVDGEDSSLMQIQESYEGKPLVVGVYDADNNLVGVSDNILINGNMVIEVATEELY